MLKTNKAYWEKLHQQPRFRPMYPSEPVIQYVFRNFKRDGKEKILDIGCGAGRHVFFMAKEKIDAYGVDISEEGVRQAQIKANEIEINANFKVGSVSSLPFEDGYFEGIISYAVLYYCDYKEIKTAIREMYRVLKSHGKGFVWVRNTDDYRFGNGTEIEKNTFMVAENDSNKCSFNENGMTMHFFTKEELTHLFSIFKNVEINKITETHNNEQYCDCNYCITFEK